LEKRKVTVTVGGQKCSFYSDDPDGYIAALEQKANEVMQKTAAFSGQSVYTNAILSVVFLADELMRAEKGNTEKTDLPENPEPAKKQAEARRTGKNTGKAFREDRRQVSVWELLDD